jgi:uncharacterized membrane protein YozB (DUF420 family)
MSISRWFILTGLGLFVTYVALRGISESWDNDSFPESLAIKLELMPVVFPVHMVTGGLALLLVPLALYLRGTRWHKIAGRIAAAVIIVAGVTAIPVALLYPVTKISGVGFATQGLVWMVLLALGIWHIRAGRVAHHRACMLMVAAVTSGALFFRIYLGLWKHMFGFKYFYSFYAVDAWIAWALPLVGMAVWLRWTRNNISREAHSVAE